MSEVAQRFEERFADVAMRREHVGQLSYLVPPERILEALGYLKEQGFDMLLDLAAVDYLEMERSYRYEVVYILFSTTTCDRLIIRAPLPDEMPTIATTTGLWASANWAEREVFDLFGIHFDGHPHLTRILMPDDWEGHPLRRDYPLEGTEPPPPMAKE